MDHKITVVYSIKEWHDSTIKNLQESLCFAVMEWKKKEAFEFWQILADVSKKAWNQIPLLISNNIR